MYIEQFSMYIHSCIIQTESIESNNYILTFAAKWFHFEQQSQMDSRIFSNSDLIGGSSFLYALLETPLRVDLDVAFIPPSSIFRSPPPSANCATTISIEVHSWRPSDFLPPPYHSPESLADNRMVMMILLDMLRCK